MQKRWQFVSRFKRASERTNEGPKSRQQRRTEAAAIVNLGVVDTVNGRRMKRRGLTGSPSAARREGSEGEGVTGFRVRRMDSTKVKRANACGFYCSCQKGRGRAGVVWGEAGEGSLAMG